MSRQQIQDPEQLQSAFEAFTRMSEQLEASYHALESRVETLTTELAAARSERLQQLAEKEVLADQLGTLLDALPGGVVVLDGNNTVCQCNPAALDLLGEPLLGETWENVTRRVLTEDQQGEHEVELLDGRRVSISRRMLDAQPGQILLLHDVTETRALQETVNRQQRLSAMGEMTARLAHQIRTPLSSALLYSSHLATGRLNAADQIRFSEKLLNGLRQLDHMVNDMLVFARGGSKVTEELSLNTLLESAQRDLAAPLENTGAVLSIDNQTETAYLQANAEAISGALVNLANNAMEAGGSDTRIRIAATVLNDEQLEIAVSDNGPGIPVQLRDRIFEPFFTTRSEGTGLGLAVVLAVVQAHRGNIRLESPVSGGTRFILTLPARVGLTAMASGQTLEDLQDYPLQSTGTEA